MSLSYITVLQSYIILQSYNICNPILKILCVVCTNKSFITYLPVFLDLVIILYIKHSIYFVLNPSLLKPP